MAIDLTSKSMLSDRINVHIDNALELERDRQKQRDYLGGSRLGVECERALQFEFFNTPKDEGKDFKGRILRVFERGHWVESACIRWLRLAGVTILTKDPETGKQFEYSSINGLVKGHSDGKIIAGPEVFGPFPRLWENKGLQQSDFLSIQRNGLIKEKPVYYGQVQIYMQSFGLTENPALFSVVNMNTMDILWLPIVYNPDYASQLDARAVRIIQACIAGELLPRFRNDPSYYLCKWCSWAERCYSL